MRNLVNILDLTVEEIDDAQHINVFAQAGFLGDQVSAFIPEGDGAEG